MGHQQFLWQFMQKGQSSYQLKRRILLVVISIRKNSDGIHLAESHVLCTCQNGCGNPERASMKTWNHPGPCRKCQSLSAVMDGCRHNSCVWCDWVDDLLSLVSVLQEEVGRLGKSEKETDLQNPSLTSWRWKQEQKTTSRGSCVFLPAGWRQ